MDDYNLVDGLSDILVRAIEDEGTDYRDDLDITTRAAQDTSQIQGIESIPETTKKMVQRYYKQKREFNHFEKMQKERRENLANEKQDLDSAVYEYLMKTNPETLEDEYVFKNPETDEETVFKVCVKQTTKSRSIPRSDIHQFIKDSVKETLDKLYPKVCCSHPFDNKDCKYLKEDIFVENFYDAMNAKLQQRGEELQSFVTHVNMERKGYRNEDSEGELSE